MGTLKERAILIARRASRTPGMITAGEVATLADAFLEATGTAEKFKDEKPAEAPAKRGPGRPKKGPGK